MDEEHAAEGLRVVSPLDRAVVERSPFARGFLDRFAFGEGADDR